MERVATTTGTSNAPAAIGRYRPLVRLGSGGMADVYLAVSRTATGLEKLAVIKRLRPDLGDDAEELAHFKAMFWDEAKLAMLLNHTNVVHTHDACEEDGHLFIVMEYIEGQSLNNVQRELGRAQRRLTDSQAAFVLSEVLAGLHYAHELRDLGGAELRLVHRDVSPQNILVSYDGGIKLVDFGVAKTTGHSTETRAGTLKGKARYMAPEQVLNEEVDHRADIYAIGVVLWELLAQKKLVAGTNMVEQLMNVIKSEPEPLTTVAPDVSPELAAIVHKALARRPGDRFATALEMREALLAIASRDAAPRSEMVAMMADVFGAKRAEVQEIVRKRLLLDAQREREGGLLSTPDLGVWSDDPSQRSLPSLTSGLPTPPLSPKPVEAALLLPGVTDASSVQGLETGSAVAAPPTSKRTVGVLVAMLAILLLVIGGLTSVALAPNPRAPAAEPPQARPETVAAPDKTVSDRASAAPAMSSPVAAPSGVPRGPTIAKVEPPGPTPRGPAAPVRPTASVATAIPTPAAPAPAEEAQASGFLTLDTYPWTKVSENGRSLGTTPLVRVPIAAGTHTLVLENPNDNVRETTTIVVKAGETVSKRLAF